MKKLLSSVIILLLAGCLNSCNFISSLSNYRSKTETFTNSLINRDFDKCVSLIDFDKVPKDTALKAYKIALDTFRSVIVRNFGTKLEYTFMRAEKSFRPITPINCRQTQPLSRSNFITLKMQACCR